MKDLKELFVPYKLALKLKEKGFDEPCLFVYNSRSKELFSSNCKELNDQPKNSDLIVSITAPLYQQTIDWFRDTHSITIESWSMLKAVRKATFETCFRVQRWGKPKGYRDSNYKTLNKAIEEALKLV